MNEADTRAELIDPALCAASWGVTDGSRTRREVIAPGRLIGGGRRAPAKYADYVLIYRNRKLAVIEAKARNIETYLTLREYSKQKTTPNVCKSATLTLPTAIAFTRSICILD